MRTTRKDISGQVINSWKVLEHSHTEGKIAYYKAECLECNKIYTVDGRNIRLKLSKRCTSCGRKASARARTGKMRKGQDPQVYAYKRIMKEYKTRALKKGKAFELSYEEFVPLTKLNCYYCGVKPENTVNPLIGHKLSEEKISLGWITYNGIDRIDSSKGYVLGNVVPCCRKCNVLKSEDSLQEMKEWLTRAYKNLIESV